MKRKQEPQRQLKEALKPILEPQRKLKEALEPILEPQRKLKEALEPILEPQRKLKEALEPILEPQRKLKEILEPINKLNETFNIWRKYAICLQGISEQIKAMNENLSYLYEQAETAQNNLFYQLQEAELIEKTAEADKYKSEAKEQQEYIKGLQEYIKGLEVGINRAFKALKPKNEAPRKHTLKPNITASQIIKLHDDLKGIFAATLEQWRALFDENEIKMPAPIEAPTISDVAVLLYSLSKARFIEQTKYPSIIERARAFSVRGVPITAKQINDTKGNYNFPYIGANREKIIDSIKAANF